MRNVLRLPILFFLALVILASCTKNEELTYIKARGTVTDIDGNQYKTVTIGHPFLDMGTQEWMAENLCVTRFRNGTAITKANSENEWHINVQTGTPHFAWNGYNEQNKGAPYGAFYNFHTVVSPSGLCPTGWRVPTIDDWEKLCIILGGHSDAGGKLKSKSGDWLQPNVDATNELEFTALPGGLITGAGHQIFVGEMAWFWSSTSYNNDTAYGFACSYSDPIFGWSPQPKFDGRSIRCVKE